jgi:phytoene dehydrogenase-like protein
LAISFSGRASQAATPQGLWQGKLYPLPISMASLATTNLFGIGDKVSFARVQKAVADGATGEDSFAAWLDGQKLSPIVRAAVEALGRVTSYANAPADVLATAMLDQMRLGLKGVSYIDGGWASLVSGLREAAVAAGATLNTGAAVAHVALEGRKIRISLADGVEHVADATLLAVGPREAAALAPSIASLGSAARDALPIRAHTLDLALRQMPERSQAFVLGVDQPVYFSVHSVAAKLAPEGGAVVHLAKYLPIDEPPSPDAMGELEAVADLAMPGWRKVEVKRQELYAMVVANGVVRPDRPRPSVELPDAPGVFIAGDWVGEEGMIADASAASAAKAASSMLTWLTANPANQSAA